MNKKTEKDISPFVFPFRFTALNFYLSGGLTQCPKNTEAQIRPRSGLALKHSITVLNSPGTIDEGYRGEVGVILINHGKQPFKVEKHMRIAQMVISKVLRVQISDVDDLSETEREKGGFGSTGLN